MTIRIGVDYQGLKEFVRIVPAKLDSNSGVIGDGFII